MLADFRFHTGEVMPALCVHYRTVGDPSGAPVLMLHGTAGSGSSLLTPSFAGALFGPGQPLDARHHWIILPDAIGTGQSSKPSDGLRACFPAYNYDDMVQAQHRLVTEHLGIAHLRLVMGHSMGGMHAWLWACRYPGFMDGVVPMAAQPTAMGGRNWMLRRLLCEMIRRDPDWLQGNYTQPPRGLALALAFFETATNGGTAALQRAAPTRVQADEHVDRLLAAHRRVDANDLLFQWEAGRDYDPAPWLGQVRADVLAINAQDDERNPVELGLTRSAIARLRRAQLLELPASHASAGHATTAHAQAYAQALAVWMRALPRSPGLQTAGAWRGG
jgi:homoserine O-acetyltransferase